MTRHLLPAIAMLSAALLAFQIILLQAFSNVQWYHFAYMVISVALLGFGASGTMLTLARDWFERHASTVLVVGTLLSGISMPASLALSQLPAASFDSYLLLTDADQVLSLVLTYVLLAVPFFFGALVIGLAFVRFIDHMGSLYFANLVGSGAGGLLGLLLLYLATPPALAGVSGLVAIAGAGLLLAGHRTRWTLTGWILAAAFAGLLILYPPPLRPSEYKDLNRALLMPGVDLVSSRPHPLGVVQIARSDLFRQAPGLSLTYSGEVPSQDLLFVNRDVSRSLGGPSAGRLRDHSTAALPYVISRPRRILVAGGIRPDVIGQALAHGVQQVVVSEPHGGVLRELVGSDSLTRYPQLHDPRVRIHEEESRSLLARSSEPFDLIVLQDIGAFGGTSGLFALQEQYDLTLEALLQMWKRLSRDGSLAVTAWVDYPPRNPLRILGTLIQMLELNGDRPVPDHLMAVRSWGAITFVASKRPVTAAEADSVLRWSERLLFDPLVLAGVYETARNQHNLMQDETLFEGVDSLMLGDRESLYDRYPFRIRPATDDRPYFSQFLKWSRIGTLREQFGEGRVTFFELGTLIVGLTLIQIAIVAVVLILLPLACIRWTRAMRGWTVMYFGGLAVGFMFLEIIMIQRFTLYLGHPILAVAFVFTVLLISSGLGSASSSRLMPHSRNLQLVTGSVVVAVVIVMSLLSAVLGSSIGLATPVKLIIGAVMLAPVSFVMGMPFPLGLRVLGGLEPTQVPWAWAINGCVSVASAPAAVLMAAEVGATYVMLAAAAVYGVVCAASRPSRF